MIIPPSPSFVFRFKLLNQTSSRWVDCSEGTNRRNDVRQGRVFPPAAPQVFPSGVVQPPLYFGVTVILNIDAKLA